MVGIVVIDPELVASARRIVHMVERVCPNPTDHRRQNTVYRVLKAYIGEAATVSEGEEQGFSRHREKEHQ